MGPAPLHPDAAQPGAAAACPGAGRGRPEPARGRDHRLRRVNDVRLHPYVVFGCWIAVGVERYPFGLLTMIVSLEAIFLSTFVLISQNRADAGRQVVADQQWSTVQEEDEQNKKLLDLSEQILALTKEVYAGSQAPHTRTRSSAENCWSSPGKRWPSLRTSIRPQMREGSVPARRALTIPRAALTDDRPSVRRLKSPKPCDDRSPRRAPRCWSNE